MHYNIYSVGSLMVFSCFISRVLFLANYDFLYVMRVRPSGNILLAAVHPPMEILLTGVHPGTPGLNFACWGTPGGIFATLYSNSDPPCSLLSLPHPPLLITPTRGGLLSEIKIVVRGGGDSAPHLKMGVNMP